MKKIKELFIKTTSPLRALLLSKGGDVLRKIPLLKQGGVSPDDHRERGWLIMGILGIIIAIAGITYFTKFYSASASEWWNDNWQYRRIATVTNSSGSAQTNLETQFVFDGSALVTAGKLQSDCDDIRVVDQDGKILKHWVEENTCNTTTTTVWAKVPSIPTTGSTINIYYGNPSAINVQEDPENMFPFYEGFSGSSIDTSTWVVTGTASFASVSAGVLTINNPSGSTSSFQMSSTDPFNATTQAVRARINYGADDGADNASNRWFGWQGTGGNRILFYKHRADTDLSAYSSSVSFSQSFFTGTWGDTYKVYSVWKDTNSMYDINNGEFTADISTEVPAETNFNINILNSTFENPNSADRIMLIDYVFVYTRVSISSSIASETTGPGPVAYWKFDEGQGTTAQDSIGAYDGSLGNGSSAPTWLTDDQCINGACLRFDGSDDYVSAGDVNYSDGLTVSLWAKHSSNLSGDDVMAAIDNAGTDRQMSFILSTGSNAVIFYHWNSSDTIFSKSATLTSANQWHHYVGTVDGSNICLYIDGISTGCSSFSGSFKNTTVPLFIGDKLFTGGNFDGAIDEVKIYSYARTADEIKQEYAARGSVHGVSAQFGDSSLGQTLSNGLVGYWKMDEAVGSTGPSWTALDSSGNGNNGTGAGNAGTTAPGKFGNGAAFTTGDYSRTNSNAINRTAGTVSGWINRTTSSTIGQTIFLASSNASSDGFGDPDPYDDFFIGIFQSDHATYPNQMEFVHQYGTGYTITYSGIQISPNTYYHFIVSWEVIGSTLTSKLYINGELVDSDSSTVDTPPALQNFNHIGGTFNSGNRRSFPGTVDEVHIYNRALSPAEVSALYNFAPGTVGHWRLDDGSGTTTVDSSSNGNNGTFGLGNSAPSWAKGKFGKSLNFDGSNDYVDLGNNSSINLAGKTLTISSWVYPTSTSFLTNDAGGIVVKRASYYSILRNVSGSLYNEVYFYGLSSPGYHRTNASIPLNRWTFLSTSWDGTNIKMYVNGVLDKTISNSGNLIESGTYSLTMGWDSYQSDFMIGSIDDARIYNYARNQKQIIEDMNAGHPAVGTPVGSTVLHLSFEEGYGTTVNDKSPQNNDGSFGVGSSAPTWTNDGKYGKALSFDGSDYLTVGSTAGILAKSYTYTAWVNINEMPPSGQYSGILTVGDDDDNAFILENNSGKGFALISSYSLAGSDIVYQGTLPSLNNWYHIAGIRDSTSSRLKLYVDGIEVSNIGAGGTGASYVAPFDTRLGHSAGAYEFNGKIDEVKIYPFALTADEVKVEYNQGKAIVLGASSTGVGGTGASFSAGREYCVPGDSTSCSAPVGEWKFDTKAGTSAYDTSGNENTGTLTGGPTWAKGKHGSGLSFDGDDDYVQVSDSSASNLTVGTVSLWVKSTNLQSGSTPGYYGIQETGSAWDNGDGSLLMRFRENSGWKIEFVYPNAGTATSLYSATTIQTNQWYFISGSYDGSTYRMYLNGRLENSVSKSGNNLDTDRGPRIGNSYSGNYFFGLIDQVRVYDYARTPAQIAWEYNQGKPIAHYRFDECQGATAYNAAVTGDRKAAGNNGTIYPVSSGNTAVGTCTSGTSTHMWYDGATGRRGASLGFDGSDDYVGISDDTTFDLSDNITLSAWVKPSTTSGIQAIIGKGRDASGTGYNLLLNSGNPGNGVCTSGGCGTNTDTSYTVSTTAWTHIVGTYNGATLSLYINGVLRKQSATTQTPTNSSEPVLIGNEITGLSRFFNGQIDEVKIYNYVLTPNQVKTDYNDSAVRFE